MDKETVITHLQIIRTWAEFARERDLQFFTAKHLEDIAKWADDALELLKEQKAQKFLVDESGKITPLPVVFPNCPLKEQEEVKPIAKEDDTFECVCGAIVGWEELDSSGIVTNRFNYCPFCGKAVKWE